MYDVSVAIRNVAFDQTIPIDLMRNFSIKYEISVFSSCRENPQNLCIKSLGQWSGIKAMSFPTP